MCGRFTLTVHHLESVVESLAAELDPAQLELYRPRYNIAPGQQHWLLRSKEGRRQIIPAGWGLINHWSKDPAVAFKQINARAETLSQRPAYREAFCARRCLLPADGFYEWRGPRGKREPMWFHDPDGGLLLLAGLYDRWQDPTTGELRKTFTIVTTEANALVKEVHHRMPVIVAAERIDDWLSGDKPEELLAPAPLERLAVKPASPRVNSVANDDPDCLNADDPQVNKQLALF